MSLINVLIGKKVTVYSRQGEVEKQDVGLLEEVDANWIRLKKADGETFFFTIYNLRTIKPFEPL
jgi:hypothetical protein